jgi:hypothetical protein
MLGSPYAVIQIVRGALTTVGGQFHYNAPPVTHWMRLPDAPDA